VVARPLRICFPGAVYHLIARGNARQRVYRDDADYQEFLEVLDHCCERFSWLCHCYCLMGNHYHLVVETPRPNLPVGMRQLNGLYARRFNLRHRRCGHVFQARYRSILIEKESHLLEACRYVVLNPVRAGICAHPRDYRWSSYRATAGLSPSPRFLCTDWILAQFGATRRLAQARYSEYVAEAIGEAVAERIRGERLGTDEFLRTTFGFEPPIPEIPREQVEPIPPSLEEIFRAHADLPVLTAYQRHGYSIREIAEHLGCHYSTVSRRLRREGVVQRTLRKCKT
jgi:putative transposase